MQVAAIVPAAGRGTRLGSKVPKPLVPVGGTPLFIRTLERLVRAYPFRRVIVPAAPRLLARMRRAARAHGLGAVRFVAGGKTRAESVGRGLREVGSEKVVLVHDMARPFVGPREVRRLIREAARRGAAILAERAVATVKEIDPASGRITATLDRNRIVLAQTPQVFRTDVLREAYRRAPDPGGFTDEAGLVEALGRPVFVVAGTSANLKITTPADLRIARVMAERGGFS
jgi:2-C-methyl-D-erythritol 4-phosphate cytidylyltransferase